MARHSAGILPFRRVADDAGDGRIEVLLVHPGGPFWARRDDGAWSIPKGEIEAGEDERSAALRELTEETGTVPAAGSDDLIPLGDVRQGGGKLVTAFALEHDLDADAIVSIEFELEWPPRSGQRRTFPEVDRAGWFSPDEARRKLLPAQVAFLDRLDTVLAADG